MNPETKCQQAQQLLQEWVDQQGHDRCWYYPDIFEKLITIFGVAPKANPSLPPLEEFKDGCRRYQQEEYGQ